MPVSKTGNNSSVVTPSEKPFHYTYLKEFRTQQCQDFLQHKCQYHRPYTCFNWHFLNQRRRRPVRKRDGTFNYSPDVYCTKFDETSGLCPDGEECAYLHRSAGDVERRYHLRYYKTGTCVHETNSRGHCIKNGPHCAFAHGPHDLRPPIYDVRELMALEGNVSDNNNTEKEKGVTVDDPKWNDTNYVLQHYKTENCKRPPRLCRQGYACPFFHNNKDKRRSPRKFKYRSTPCPQVKHGDEWGEPSNCEQGEHCGYCHTRTEQQFHPEIYKSTKCNDMQQTGFCPRGPFCAFAHVDQEMTASKDIYEEPTSTRGNVPPQNYIDDENSPPLPVPQGNMYQQTPPAASSPASLYSTSPLLLESSSLPIPNTLGPIGKPRSNSNCSNLSSDSLSLQFYQKAPGSEREDSQTSIRKQILKIENDHSLDEQEKNRRKQNLFNSMHNSRTACGTSPSISQVSPLAPSFYPASDTVESVVGSALDDLNLDEFDMNALDRELENDTASSIGSSGTGVLGHTVGSQSLPVSIPGTEAGQLIRPASHPSAITATSDSAGSSPLAQLPPPFIPQHIQQQQQQQQQIEQAAAAFLSQPNPQPLGMRQLAFLSSTSSSPLSGGNGGGFVGGHSPLSTTPTGGSLPDNNHADAPHEQNNAWNQQQSTGGHAWKSDAEQLMQAVKEKDEALFRVKELEDQVTGLSAGGPYLHILHRVDELERLPLGQLKQLQMQLHADLEHLEKLVYTQQSSKCMVCEERNRCVSLMPCQHYVVCEHCAPSLSNCPLCHVITTQRTPSPSLLD